MPELTKEKREELKAKILLSKHVLNLQDKAKESILRDIIYSLAEIEDWHTVINLIYNYMPELKLNDPLDYDPIKADYYERNYTK
jgi:hypothetical protein